MNNVRSTLVVSSHPSPETSWVGVLFALVACLIASAWYPENVDAQGRPRRPTPAERRSIAPVPLDAEMSVPISQPLGTVRPMAIGPAPGFYSSRFAPPPFTFGPPPSYFGGPDLGMSPFVPPSVGPLNQPPIGQSTNYLRSPAVPDSSPPRVEDAAWQSSVPSNIRISISEAFLNRLIEREEVQPGDVQDTILGAKVTGRQTTTSRLKLDLQPATDKGRAAFVLTGDVQTLTTGVTPQAMVDTAGQQQFFAVKDVFFDGQQLSTRHATVFVRARNQTLGAMTPLSGSLFGGLADRIAYRTAERRKPETEAIARDRVADKVYPSFDGEIDRQLTTANQFLDQNLRRQLQVARLLPFSQSVSTTDDRFHYAAMIGSVSTIASSSKLDSQMARDGELNLSLHESLLNELIGHADLRGFKTTDKELQQQLADATAMINGLKSTLPDDPAGANPFALPFSAMNIVTDIEFDATDPLSVRLDNDRLLATMKAKFKPAGQDLLPPVQVTIEYRIVIGGHTMRMVPGQPTVKSMDRTDDSMEPTVAETAIQKSISLNLPTFEINRVLPSNYWQHNGPAPAVTSIKSRDGWMSISID